MEINILAEDQYRSISDAYDGKSIFVTGATGFLGKIFVEKILYDCPRIAKVYVIIRNDEKTTAEEKYMKMLSSPVFERLRENRPQDLKKIVWLVGDITKPNLGLKIDDEKLLIENVSMVFHFAASVRFVEPIEVALNVNVGGTKRILELGTKMKLLQVFIYVSTAYSNADRKVIDEIIYPSPLPLDEIDELMKHTHTEKQTLNILNGWPNTYTLTKAVAENLIWKFHKDNSLPSIIVRPSAVTACKNEPIRGWIDSWLGAAAVVFATSKGLLRVLHTDGNNTVDMIPADYVVNCTIAAAASFNRSEEFKVYNSCSSTENPLTFRKLGQSITKDSIKHKINVLPKPGFIFIKNKWIRNIVIFVLEIVPVFFTDCLMRISGKEPRYTKIQSRISNVRKVQEYFTSNTWAISSRNTSALYNSLPPNDRLIFNCNAADINWDEYLPEYFKGVRNNLLVRDAKAS